MVLPRLVPHNQILRGKIFNVALPFTSGRPLDFVVEDENNKGLFRIVQMDDGFLPVYNEKLKRKTAPVVKAVCEFKMRPAIVIQNNEFNAQQDYYQTIVLPITSIKDEVRKDPVIQQLVTTNDVEYLHYLGDLLHKESYVVISDLKRIHKNLLFKTKTEMYIKDADMEAILVKLAQCFKIKKIRECDECERNCEKCEYKLAVNK